MNQQPLNKSEDAPFLIPHNFEQLVSDYPELVPFLVQNKHDKLSIDFYNPKAVKVFNQVLLKAYYGIAYWDFPDGSLCPPVPGRADYLYAVKQLLEETRPTTVATPIHVLDVGVGANCIYPLIGHQAYGWQFTGSDISLQAIQSAQNIVTQNGLEDAIKIRHQYRSEQIFSGINGGAAYFDVTICNPPFYASEEEAIAATRRRLKHRKAEVSISGFSGSSNELWCRGGELQFISTMIEESVVFADHCGWFTVLVSKGGNLDQLLRLLDAKAAIRKVIPLERGNKVRRVIAWRFPKDIVLKSSFIQK